MIASAADIASWKVAASRLDELDAPFLLSSSLGQVILKRRPRSSLMSYNTVAAAVAVDCIDVHTIHASHRVQVAPISPDNAAVTASDSSFVALRSDDEISTIGTLDHEWRVLRLLHSNGVRCIPSFAYLLVDESSETMIQPWMSEEEGWRSMASIAADTTIAIATNIPAHSSSHHHHHHLLLSSSAVIHALLDGLHQIHGAGVAIGDLKPEHILLRVVTSTHDHSNAASLVHGSSDRCQTVECCFVDFDLATVIQSTSSAVATTMAIAAATSPPASASVSTSGPTSNGFGFIGSPPYASILQHLGGSTGSTSAAAAADSESLLYIFAETCMKQFVDREWNLPWNRTDLTPGADVDTDLTVNDSADPLDAFLHRLVADLERASFSPASIHRIAAHKLAIIQGRCGSDTIQVAAASKNPSSPSAEAADAIFNRCMRAVRDPLIKLLVGSDPIPLPPLLEFARQFNECLAERNSSASSSSASSALSSSSSSASIPTTLPYGHEWSDNRLQQLVTQPCGGVQLASSMDPSQLALLERAFSSVFATPTTNDASLPHSMLLLMDSDGTTRCCFSNDSIAASSLPAVTNSNSLLPLHHLLVVRHSFYAPELSQTEKDVNQEEGFADELLTRHDFAPLYAALQRLDAFCAQQQGMVSNDGGDASSSPSSSSLSPTSSAAAAAAMLLCSSHRPTCMLLWRPSVSTSLSSLRLLFRALLSSLALFSLPYLHLSIMLGRFAILISESQVVTPSVTLLPSHSSPSIDMASFDTSAAMMLQSMLQQRSSSRSAQSDLALAVPGQQNDEKEQAKEEHAKKRQKIDVERS